MSPLTVGITSFGFAYYRGRPPKAHVVVDVREHLYDPYFAGERLLATARDAGVRARVMSIQGIRELLAAYVGMVEALWMGPGRDIAVEVAVGCTYGRHRSAAVAMALDAIFRGDMQAAREMPVQVQDLAERYVLRGVQVTLGHRDIDKQLPIRR